MNADNRIQGASDASNRAGRYVKQPTGYRAFIPSSLPPDPPINVNSEMQALLSRADRALGRLDGSIQTLPHADLFVAMYVRKEAVLSSQIEGTQSSLRDVLAAEAKIMSAERPGDVQEVVNYVHAMNYGLERLEELPVSIRLIREIHEQLMQGVRGQNADPGELRRSQNWIGPGSSTLAEASFVPPPPGVVPEVLGDLERFLHENTQLPLLVKIGLVHAQFETIHPFLDGNGRIGRLLITFFLCQNDILIKPVLYLSYYLKQHRQEYYDLLQSVRDHGKWEDWLMFFLQGIFEVSQEATETARKILLLREKHRERIAANLGRAAGNGHLVLEHLFGNPIISVAEVQELIGASYPAANQLVQRLDELDVVQELTGQKRNRRFGYNDYIGLFHNA